MKCNSIFFVILLPGCKWSQDIHYNLSQLVQVLALAILPAEFKISQIMAVTILGNS